MTNEQLNTALYEKLFAEQQVHLDNDAAGRNAANVLSTLLAADYDVKNNTVPFGKDVNDYLRYKLNLLLKSERTECR